MTKLYDEPPGATPLTAEYREGLIPSHITLRNELNELEQHNILEADVWAFERKRNPLNAPFVQSLHRRMFRNVWRWAGTYRTTNNAHPGQARRRRRAVNRRQQNLAPGATAGLAPCRPRRHCTSVSTSGVACVRESAGKLGTSGSSAEYPSLEAN